MSDLTFASHAEMADRIAALEARCARAEAEGALLLDMAKQMAQRPPEHGGELVMSAGFAPLAEAAARVLSAAKAWNETNGADPLLGEASVRLGAAVDALLALEAK